jgi:hypothetical protein
MRTHEALNGIGIVAIINRLVESSERPRRSQVYNCIVIIKLDLRWHDCIRLR